MVKELTICLMLMSMMDNSHQCRSATPVSRSIVGHITSETGDLSNCSHITYAHGLLMNSRASNCTFMINGNTFTTSASAMRVPLHGLLRYTCEGCSGSLILTGACNDCADCATIMNTHVCLSDDANFWMGLTIGISSAILLSFATYLALRWIESKTQHKKTFDQLSLKKRKKDKNSDTDTDSANDMPISTCPPAWMVCCVLLFVSPTDAMYQTSVSTYCNETACSDYTVIGVNLYNNEPRVLQMIDGSKIILRIADMHYEDVYHPVYKTADYTINVEQTYSCKGSGGCWNPGDCHAWAKPKQFKWDTNQIHGGGCLESSIGCEEYCFHHTACIYYKWTLNLGQIQHQVYEYSMTVWHASVEITTATTTNILKFSGSKGSVGWHDTSYDYPVEVHINSMIEMRISDKVIHYLDSYIPIQGSTLGAPMPKLIGDTQIAAGETFDPESVHCAATSCNATCRHPTPAIRRLDTTQKLNCKASNDWLECSRPLPGTLSLRMGAGAVAKEINTKARCDFDIPVTWACSDCPTAANFVVRPFNILSQGSFKVESNCTLSTNTFSCVPHPYTISILDGGRVCWLHAVTINKTMTIRVAVVDNKMLEPDYGVTVVGTDIWAQVNSVFASDTFYSPLASTLQYYAILASILISCRYLIAFCMIYRLKAGPANT